MMNLEKLRACSSAAVTGINWGNLWWICFFLGILGAPQTVSASPVWEWSGTGGASEAFSGRVSATGPAATYFNPALLRGESSAVQFGSSVLAGRLSVKLDARPSGVDISSEIYDARVEGEDGRRSPPSTRPLATDELPNSRGNSDPSFGQLYLTMGLVTPLVEDRWTVGVLATVPADQFADQRPHYVDEREQYFTNSLHFERMGDRFVGPSIALGSGVKIVDWLDVGVGVLMAQDAKSDNAVFTPDPTAPDDSRVTTGVNISTRAVPHLGIHAQPGSNWGIVATVHAPYENRVVGENELRFWNFPASPEDEDSLSQEMVYVFDYLPLRVATGLRYRRGDDDRGGEVGASVLFGRWSQYRDRQGESWPEQWRNTIRSQFYGRWNRGEQTWSADIGVEPSAVRPQTGRTNFVDNHRVMLSAVWSRQMEWAGRAFSGGVQIQGHWLLEQQVTKEEDAEHPVIDEFPESVHVQSGETIDESLDFRTNNPGYPGYQTSGVLVGGGLFLKTQW